jgi:uncharacterized protein YxeA
MLRKIISILITIIVIVIIGAFTINYYNSSKLEGNNVNKNEEVIKNNKSNNKTNDDNNVNEEESKDEESDSYDEINDEESEEKEIIGEEIAVSSTSSFKNSYIYLIGGTIIILGIGSVIFKYNN